MVKTSNCEIARGFTLIELIVVISIISILSIIAIPSFLNWLPNIELQSAARDLVSDMEEAKIAAIKTNGNVVFTFNTVGTCPGGGYTFTDVNGETVAVNSFKNGLCLSASGSDFLAGDGFTPRGFPINPPLPPNDRKTVTLTHLKSASSFKISQNVSGGISLVRM